MPSPSTDAPRIFTGIDATYDRVGAVLSFGQDPRWRRALVASVGAKPSDVVLDVATGTGMVARALGERYGCRVIGLDQSADMLRAAAARDGHIGLVRGRAEWLPFPDVSFDHLTFTYLLRYVDDPAAVMRELARVVRPGGRVAAVDFGVPSNPVLRMLWRAYTRIGLPVLGRAVSRRWSDVGAFLGGSIEGFASSHSWSDVERYWREAGLVDVRVRPMSFGAGVLISATKLASPAREVTQDVRGAAFYALRPGGARDYWTLLHPPYTLWHLSYVLLGAALAPSPDPRIVLGALLAFFLAVGIASHSFDELQGRPLGTKIPSGVLIALGALGLAGAVALGIIAASQIGLWFLALVAIGAALVVSYGLELPIVHSDLGFATAWGAFPVVAAGAATGAAPLVVTVAAFGAALLSLAQRRLSTPVRRVRRKAASVTGTIRYRDGTVEEIDSARFIAAPESALRLLWLAIAAVSFAILLSRWI